MSRPSVLLTTEGTYPFHKGGVSTWCEVLTSQLQDFDFHVLAITMHPYLAMQYAPATNTRVLSVPLWGTEHPAEFDTTATFQDYLNRRWRCLPSALSRGFIGAFSTLVDLTIGHGLDLPVAQRDQLADTLVVLHEFFQEQDMTRAFFARQTFTLFEDQVRGLYDGPITAADVAEALRLFYRLLLVLSVSAPRTDVTHASAAAFCGLPCVIARRRHGTPYLLTEHGIYAREQYLNLRRVIPSPFVRWFMYRLCGAVAAVNYHVADQISPVCGYNTRWEMWGGADPSRIKVIYNGVDPARFAPLPQPFAGPPTVANVGLIYPLKGQLWLIEAANLVRREIPDLRVLLYGSPSDDAYYAECQRRVRELGLEQTVTFAGSTSTPWTAYQQASVVAMSSISEAFPYAVIEAMLCGATLVATDTGGVSEAIGETGIIVPPRDAARMADGLTHLLRHPELRADLGRRARERALTHFTQAQFLATYRHTYQELAGRRVVTPVLADAA